MRSASTRLGWVLLTLGTSSGCAGTITRSAERATPIVTTQVIDGVYQDRQLLGNLMSDPAIVHGTSELGAATVRGVLQEVEVQGRGMNLERLSRQFWDPLRSGMELELRAELGPELVPILSESFDRSLESALDDETRERARVFALSISEATARGFVQGLGDELSSRIGDDAPSLEVAKLARAASRGAALGLQDAVQETEQRRRTGNAQPGDVLGVASEAANAWVRLLRVLPMLLAALAIVVSGAAIWMLFRLHRDLRRLLEQRSGPPERPQGGGHAYAGE